MAFFAIYSYTNNLQLVVKIDQHYQNMQQNSIKGTKMYIVNPMKIEQITRKNLLKTGFANSFSFSSPLFFRMEGRRNNQQSCISTVNPIAWYYYASKYNSSDHTSGFWRLSRLIYTVSVYCIVRIRPGTTLDNTSTVSYIITHSKIIHKLNHFINNYLIIF